MSKLSLEQFNKLSEKEKGERYKDLSDNDKLMVRLTVIPKGSTLVGYKKLTEKQKEEAKEFEEAVKLGKINEWFSKR